MMDFSQVLELTFGLKVLVKTNYFEIDMLATGKKDLDTVKVSFTIQTGPSMRENGSRISSTVLEFLHLKMVQHMKDHSKTTEWLREL